MLQKYGGLSKFVGIMKLALMRRDSISDPFNFIKYRILMIIIEIAIQSKAFHNKMRTTEWLEVFGVWSLTTRTACG